MIFIMKATAVINVKLIVTIAIAFFTALSSILLLNTVMSLSFFKVEKTLNRMIANVVVLIPPAVEPLEPPMNIKTIVKSFD